MAELEEPEATEYDVDTSYDPFGKDVHTALLITNLKIYDVLMALLAATNPDAADRLDDAHSKGLIVNAGPQFTGFIPPDA